MFDVSPNDLDGPGIRMYCERCKSVFSVDSVLASTRVVVAIDNPAAVEVLRTIIEPAGLSLLAVNDGEQLLEAVKQTTPWFVICDVALSKVYAFAAVAALKKMTPPPYVILLASVYDRAAYKRTPHSLHGADDYLELHHIPDRLPGMLAKVFGKAAPALDTHHVRSQRDTLREASQENEGQRLEAARALAWRLVLDVSLYQQERFKQSMADGTIKTAMRSELDEATQFLQKRMEPGERHQAASLLDEALQRLIREQAEGAR